MSATPKRHTPTRLSDYAYGSIYKMIVNGKLRPGDWLLEVELSETLGISRTPVRDALRRLVERGLAQNYDRGIAVTELSLAKVQELYDFRSALEALAAELAAQRMGRREIGSGVIDELKQINVAISKAASGGDTDIVNTQNMALHYRIAELADNSFLQSALANIWDVIAISSTTIFAGYKWGARVYSHHDEIIGAIATGDAIRARDIAREHVMESKRVYTQVYNSSTNRNNGQ